ncbi:tripartite tricarboxylate transporter TctB family protein [Salicibibacter cibi]|uniref:Tripartite tricarboxylate transporter TctB family protein n=1 Tax=Salicibibacter cibi TaxID=2743001 RepID=A0A7T7CH03_9BACI|nr:tripartite tricarboxylate transporter TctB family protein [Salicibibacter cibi]QQK81722.1 tripartite tricarboxylate transporter TctB family protein [Salicibibacter cibi]
MTMNQKISIPLLVLAVSYIIASILLPTYEYIIIDANAFPILLGSLLIILSVILFFTKSDEGASLFVAKKDFKVIATVLGMLLIYILLLEHLGFVFITTLFIFICSLFLGYRNHIANAIVSIIVPISLYLLFTRYLMIALPEGILPF